MKKADLKTGMVVKYRVGIYRLVLEEMGLVHAEGFNSFDNYDENMFAGAADNNIEEVYSPYDLSAVTRFLSSPEHNPDLSRYKLIWSRKDEAQKQLIKPKMEVYIGKDFCTILDVGDGYGMLYDSSLNLISSFRFSFSTTIKDFVEYIMKSKKKVVNKIIDGKDVVYSW